MHRTRHLVSTFLILTFPHTIQSCTERSKVNRTNKFTVSKEGLKDNQKDSDITTDTDTDKDHNNKNLDQKKDIEVTIGYRGTTDIDPSKSDGFILEIRSSDTECDYVKEKGKTSHLPARVHLNPDCNFTISLKLGQSPGTADFESLEEPHYSTAGNVNWNGQKNILLDLEALSSSMNQDGLTCKQTPLTFKNQEGDCKEFKNIFHQKYLYVILLDPDCFGCTKWIKNYFSEDVLKNALNNDDCGLMIAVHDETEMADFVKSVNTIAAEKNVEDQSGQILKNSYKHHSNNSTELYQILEAGDKPAIPSIAVLTKDEEGSYKVTDKRHLPGHFSEFNRKKFAPFCK